MEFLEWAPYYERIRREFGFSMERERAAAERLVALLPIAALSAPLERARPRIADRDVVVVGLAPRAGAPPVWRLPPDGTAPVVVAADGATLACLNAGIIPTIVVTDLDGPVASEVAANARGALVIVHAHGDNVPALERWVPEFSGELAGSWAGPPTEGLLDVGGFTDGDRAACLAAHLGARRILLWGFDFDRPDGATESERAQKQSKLRWAERILALLARGPVPLSLWRRDGSLVPYPPAAAGASTQ